ncbi:MAG: hypothetical protein J5742_00095 [Alphaproteobacteria bacterium]|nr:hypothetical protein [Alphaproteobacteria bacterium]
MGNELERDVFCLYRGTFVARSEFNSNAPAYHESEHGDSYMASPYGECKCISCCATNRLNCVNCDMPKILNAEFRTEMLKKFDLDGNYLGAGMPQHRCDMCMAQYKQNGHLR